MKLSLKDLSDDGWHPYKVEYWDGYARKTRDLMGFTDILATKPGCSTRLIQTTTRSNISARRRKILKSEDAMWACQGGLRIFIHGWDQPGGKYSTPRLKPEEVTLGQIMLARAGAGAMA